MPNPRDENKNLVLNSKKKKFFEVVFSICKKRDLPVPKLNFEGCDGEDEAQLAHYHSDSNIICVSHNQLHKLSIEDVGDTAAHEV